MKNGTFKKNIKRLFRQLETIGLVEEADFDIIKGARQWFCYVGNSLSKANGLI